MGHLWQTIFLQAITFEIVPIFKITYQVYSAEFDHSDTCASSYYHHKIRIYQFHKIKLWKCHVAYVSANRYDGIVSFYNHYYPFDSRVHKWSIRWNVHVNSLRQCSNAPYVILLVRIRMLPNSVTWLHTQREMYLNINNLID